MSGPLSMKLRERVVRAYEKGQGTTGEVAARFGVGETTLRRWVKLKRDNGTVAPRPRGGGPPSRLDASGLNVLRELLEAETDSMRDELADELEERTGTRECGDPRTLHPQTWLDAKKRRS